MDFYSNKLNDSLKFKINSEGIDTNMIETRLILKTSENKNYLLFGKLNGNICKFDIPKLELYEKGDSGTIKFEIISEDLYFKVWEDNFDITTKATVQLESLVNENTEIEEKPKITASVSVEPLIEKKEEDLEDTHKQEKKLAKKDLDEEMKEYEKDKKDKKVEEKSNPVKNFSAFLK